MDSTLAPSGSATGPVTFSHVFGQQCQLMEAGRRGSRGALSGAGGCPQPRPVCARRPRLSLCLACSL